MMSDTIFAALLNLMPNEVAECWVSWNLGEWPKHLPEHRPMWWTDDYDTEQYRVYNQWTENQIEHRKAGALLFLMELAFALTTEEEIVKAWNRHPRSNR